MSGRFKMEQGVRISHEWIYQYIYADKHSGGDPRRSLRCQKGRGKRYGSYDRRGIIPGQPNETVFQLPLTYFVAGT